MKAVSKRIIIIIIIIIFSGERRNDFFVISSRIIFLITCYKTKDATAENAINVAFTELAMTVPSTLGPSALTYIIFAGTFTWPALYFLQIMNFATRIVRLGWINRLLKGG